MPRISDTMEPDNLLHIATVGITTVLDNYAEAFAQGTTFNSEEDKKLFIKNLDATADNVRKLYNLTVTKICK